MLHGRSDQAIEPGLASILGCRAGPRRDTLSIFGGAQVSDGILSDKDHKHDVIVSDACKVLLDFRTNPARWQVPTFSCNTV